MNLSVWLCSRLLTSLLYSRIANPARSRRVLDHNCHQPTTHQVPPHLFAELMRTIDKADLYRREGNRVTGLETTQKPTGEKLRSLARVYPPPTSSSVGDRANFSTRPLSLSALKKSTETDLWRFVRNYVSKAWLRVLKVFPRPCPPFFSPVYSYASAVRILLLSMTRTMQLLLRTHAKRAKSIVASALKRRDLLQMPGEKTTQIESRKSESARTVGALRSDPSPCLRVGAPGVLQYMQRWYFSPRYSLELDTLKSPSIRVEAQVCARYAYCDILFHLVSSSSTPAAMALVAPTHKLGAILRYCRDQTILSWISSRFYLAIANQMGPYCNATLSEVCRQGTRRRKYVKCCSKLPNETSELLPPLQYHVCQWCTIGGKNRLFY